MIIAGKYEVLGRLGQGGQGSVYKVRHLGLDDVRALKVQPDQGTGEEMTARFRREGKALARLKHPHIVQVFDLGRDEAQGQYYLDMEYVDGPNLAQYLKAHGRPPLLDALEIARQVADALAFAHTQPYVDAAGEQHTGMVHRDIKPSNILLRDQTPIYALLADFGLVKLGDAGERTTTGTMLGTYKYSAPEQLGFKRNRQRVPVDFRADVFAFGLVLYELFEGRQFHAGLEPQEILARVLFDTESLEPEFTASVSAPLRALMCRMIQRDPERRPSTMREVLAVIDEALNDLRQGDGGTVVLRSTSPGAPGDASTETEEEIEQQIGRLMAERERRRTQAARVEAEAARARAREAEAAQLATAEFEAAVRQEEEASVAFSAGDVSQARALYERTATLFAAAETLAAAARARREAEAARERADGARTGALDAGASTLANATWSEAEQRFAAANALLASDDVPAAQRAFEAVEEAFEAARQAAVAERDRRRRAGAAAMGAAAAARDEAAATAAAQHAPELWRTASDAFAAGEREARDGDGLDAAATFQRAADAFAEAGRFSLDQQARAARAEAERVAAGTEAAGAGEWAPDELAAARRSLEQAEAALGGGDVAGARALFADAASALAAVTLLASQRREEARRQDEERRRQEARRGALAAREGAATARREAEHSAAAEWAGAAWQTAEARWAEAEEQLAAERFGEAQGGFEAAVSVFRAAGVEAARAVEEAERRRRAEEERARQLAAVAEGRRAASEAAAQAHQAAAAELAPSELAAAERDAAAAEAAAERDAFEDAVESFGVAARGYEHATRTATVERARRQAVAAREVAVRARADAEHAAAERWEPSAWRAAEDEWLAADAATSRAAFDEATTRFAEAGARFETVAAAARAAAEADRLRREEEARRVAAERAEQVAAVDTARAAAQSAAARADDAGARALAAQALATAAARMRDADAAAGREAFGEAVEGFEAASLAYDEAAGRATVEAARRRAVAAREQAEAGRERAMQLEAERWAPDTWHAAEAGWHTAEEALAATAFDEAHAGYTAAESVFGRAANSAREAAEAERQRLEDERLRAEAAAAEQRRVEEERRRAEAAEAERQAAEARQRAEEEAAARRQEEEAAARRQEEAAREQAAERERRRAEAAARDAETIVVPPMADEDRDSRTVVEAPLEAKTIVEPPLEAKAIGEPPPDLTVVVEPPAVRVPPPAPPPPPVAEARRAWWPYAAATGLLLAVGVGYLALRPGPEMVAPRGPEEAPAPVPAPAPPPQPAAAPPEPQPVAPAPPPTVQKAAPAPPPPIPGLAWNSVSPGAGEPVSTQEGKRTTFEVAVTQAETRPGLDIRWLLDGKEVGRGTSWEYAPGFADGGRAHTVEAVATSEGARLEQKWDVTVADVDRPTVIGAASPREETVTIEAGKAQRFALRAEDPDEGDRLTYTWERNGKRVASGPEGEVTIPDAVDGEEIRVTVSGKGGDSVGSRAWRVAVKSPPPVVPVPPRIVGQTPAPKGRLAVEEGKVIDFGLKVRAPDPKAKLAYAWFLDGKPVGMDKSFRYQAPSLEQRKVASRIEVEVSDATGLTSGRVGWDVDVLWAPPEVARLEPKQQKITIEPGDTRELRAGARAAAEGPITYEWRVNGRAGAPTASGLFRLPADLPEGTNSIEVAALDQRGLRSDPQRWSVEVRPVPPPTVPATAPPPTSPPTTLVSRLPPPAVPRPDAAGSLTDADVRDWIARYESAWGRKDAAALVALGVTTSDKARAIASKVGYLRQVRTANVTVSPEGAGATVSFDRTDIADGGKELRHPRKTCRLRRVGGQVAAVGGCL